MPIWPLFTLPWIALALFVALRVRLPRELPPPADAPGEAPLVSVIVPARDEARHIGALLDSLTRSSWPRFEIVVVDDRSSDGTGDIARAATPGRAERLEVVDGEPLPEGWMGKPWACWQGAARARGELLLFTDADTVHGPDLLARSVAALEGALEGHPAADVVTVAGRQLMETFWERLVQPQIFINMVFRYPDTSRPIPRTRWRDAIANGQYILFRRGVYEAMGGHEAVKDEVAEDLRLAQILVRDGWRFRMFRAEDALATRMYTSLREIVAGWSKNVIMGGLATVRPALRPVLGPVFLAVNALLWLVPPVVLVGGLAGVLAGGLTGAAVAPGWIGGSVVAWAAAVVAVSAVFWCAVTARFGAPWAYGLLYPLGAAVGWFIVLRGWLRMDRVEWKGRTYRARLPAE